MTGNTVALARNMVLLLASIVAWKWLPPRERIKFAANDVHALSGPGSTAPITAMRAKGFSTIEVLVVVAIMGMLMGLLIPSLHLIRASATRTACQANLMQLSAAYQRYANDFAGWIPREGDPTSTNFDRFKPWPIVLNYYWASLRPIELNRQVLGVKTLQCPGQPFPELIPVSYEANAMAFSDAFPLADGELMGPTKLTEIRRPSEVVLLKEVREGVRAADRPELGVGSIDNPIGNFWPGYWDFWRIVDLPYPLGAVDLKRRYTHFPDQFNALFFDGHVATVFTSDMTLRMFDDGIRSHPNRRSPYRPLP